MPFNQKICSYEELSVDKKLIGLLQESLLPVSEDEKKEFQYICLKFFELGFDVVDNLNNYYLFDIIHDKEIRKDVIRTICSAVKNNKDASVFLKELFTFFGNSLYSFFYRLQSVHDYDDIWNNSLSLDRALEIFDDYIPKGIDKGSCCMEYATWGHAYLYKKIKRKEFIAKFISIKQYGIVQDRAIDSLFYVFEKLGDFLNFPPKLKNRWKKFIFVWQNGVKSLPPEMKEYLVDMVECIVNDQQIINFMSIIDSAILVKYQKNRSDASLEGEQIYQDFVDLLFIKVKQIAKKQKMLSFSKYGILERLLFNK